MRKRKEQEAGAPAAQDVALFPDKVSKSDDQTLGSVTTTTGQALRDTFKALVKGGALRALTGAREYLQEEIASGDKGRILRAFHDIIYSRSWRMSEAVPALQSSRSDSDPYARLCAARDLFIVGNESGYQALLALVQSANAIPGLGGGPDVRIEAATTLAQFRQTGATQAIYSLYQETNSPDIMVALATLSSPAAAALTERRGYFSDAASLVFYGQANATQFIPKITSTFQNTTNPEVKSAAAWALATMTGDEDATDFLVSEAQSDLQDPSKTGSSSERDLISYLGTIQVPAAKQVLESALGSTDPTVVQTAVTNLIYNQGGSDKAVQVIADQLNDSTHAVLPWDFTLNMATQLISDPRIQTAGQTFAKVDATDDWDLYTVERRDWSVYSWLKPLKLNQSKQP